MNSVTLCADDFGIAPGVNQAILELASMRRLSAVSCLVDYEQFERDGAELAQYRHALDIGLHISLTGTKPLWRVLAEGYLGLLPQAAMAQEIGRQIEAFHRVMGFYPSYLDGHHHVHNLGGVREAVVAWAEKIGAYVRVTAEPLSLDMLQRPAPLTVAFLAWMGRPLLKACEKRGIPTNALFRGVRSFKERQGYRGLFLRAASGVRSGTIIMCHPGWPDEILVERDLVVQARMGEMRYLRSDDFLRDLARLGLSLTPFSSHISADRM